MKSLLEIERTFMSDFLENLIVSAIVAFVFFLIMAMALESIQPVLFRLGAI